MGCQPKIHAGSAGEICGTVAGILDGLDRDFEREALLWVHDLGASGRDPEGECGKRPHILDEPTGRCV
jgi:hypothetical protein